ncbi:MAG: Ig-like domain-containing protein [Clostridiales bacterium]|nr:Ig-like domain-containing protein [Clostridiales bacterium]
MERNIRKDKNHVGSALRLVITIIMMILCFHMPASSTITAEAASTSVKALTVGKSYTVSGYSKVKSSKTSVATAKKKSTKKYKVTAKKKGTAVVKCYSASGKLVKKIYLIATNSASFKYDTSAVTLSTGSSKTVKATVQSGCTVKYSSSKKSVATVNSKGMITAKSSGTATISARVYYKGKLLKTFKKKVTVTNAAAATVTASSASGSSSSDSNSSNSSGSGSSTSNNTNGTTSSSGSAGTTSTAPTLSVSCDTSAVTISPGKSVTAKATVTSSYKVAYSSSDTSVATVTSAGKITGVSGGSVTITVSVSYNGTVKKTLTKSVTVRTYRLSSSSLSINSKESTTVKCETDAGEYSTSDTFVWSSSDTSVVKVTGSGNSCTVTSVAAGKSGTATVTCKVNGKVTLTCEVTVNKAYVYRVSDGLVSISGGKQWSVALYCENASDEVEFQFSSDCVQVTGVDGPIAFYDSQNETNAFYTRVRFYGRRQETCNLYVYLNGSLFQTVTVEVTSTDSDYLAYVSWRKGIEAKLWINENVAGLTDIEKISMLVANIYNKYGYDSSRSSAYCFSDGQGGDCWAYAMLACDVAADLGYESDTVRMSSASSQTHRDARININGTYYIVTQTGYVYDSNENPIGYGNVTEDMRGILKNS